MPNIFPDWPAPANIHALTTTRQHGASLAPFDSNNLAFHVEDNPAHVQCNREALQSALQLPSAPQWLTQTHSTLCIIPENDTNRHADAAITRCPATVLAIMTADCLPILLCNRKGTEIAAIHAGWKGLAQGIIEHTIAKMESHPADILAWCGPAICQNCFEVGDEVLQAYRENYSFAEKSFRKKDARWLANLASLATDILINNAIVTVYQSNICTFECKNELYSYRREKKTGRMATLIWFT